jgi:hypothetical protein
MKRIGIKRVCALCKGTVFLQHFIAAGTYYLERCPECGGSGYIDISISSERKKEDGKK